jgi:hypothetical protein
MPEAKHAKPTSLFQLSNPVAEIFARSADQWFATQAALLADVDALTHAWLHRRRANVDATQQAIQQMAGCQNPGEMLHIHQEWLSGVFSRVTEDIAAFNTSISSIAKGATDRRHHVEDLPGPLFVHDRKVEVSAARIRGLLVRPAELARKQPPASGLHTSRPTFSDSRWGSISRSRSRPANRWTGEERCAGVDIR